MEISSTLLLAVLMVCVCLYYYFVLQSKLKYFERLKVPHVPPVLILGNMAPFIFGRLSMIENIRKIYDLFSNTKYFGFYDFMTPIYVMRDLKMINMIAIKNFDNFCDHRSIVNEELEPLTGRNLFDLKGDRWREMRKLLSPCFTSSKMKMMFGLICQCADNFSNSVMSESKTGKVYDMKETLCRYATDVIATCVFGISVDSFNNPNNEFLTIGKIINLDTKKNLTFLLNRNCPWLNKLFRMKLFSPKVEKFFKEIVTDTVKARDKQGIIRPDMVQLMMETRDKSHGLSFDIDEIAAQAFFFFLSGFDALSTLLCFATYEIGVNPEIQDKLRAEIEDVVKQTNGQPTYETIKYDMKYLNAVMNETLRMYPLTFFLERVCVKEFELPPATPDRNPVIIKPGDNIWFPHYILQHDPKYYPQPEKFDPDRFLNDQVDNSVYMPFGIGPRICIAHRFVLMEVKVMLFYLLWRCVLEPAPKTKVPMVLNKKLFVMQADGGFWLKVRAKESSVGQ